MAELTSSSDSKFKMNDLVWAKVKGFNYWPAKIVENTKNIKYNRKIKNPHCVLFYYSKDYAVLSEDQIKPYEEYREQFSNIPKKTKAFLQAIEQIEQEFGELKGTSSTTTVSSTTPTPAPTPAISSNKTELFKTKKPAASPSTVARDYSRTPFKKEKRNFDSLYDSDRKKATVSTTSKTNSEDSKKKMKLTVASPTSSTSYKPSVSVNCSASPKKETAPEMKMMNKSHKSEPSSLKFGFIGLGKMGKQLVTLLINSGHEITIWNRTPSKCKDFEKLGANIVKTPGDVVRESDITFSCLSDSNASQTIFFGNCGVGHEINATKGYVELTSMDYNMSVEIEHSVKAKGGRYLEAQILICSLEKQIAEGKLMALVSGNRSLFDDCSSCFEAICSNVYFLSENAGIASKMNIIISTFYGNLIGSLMECMTLVERFGLIHRDFVEIISNSPLKSAMIDSKSESLIDSTLIREVPVDHIRRDLNYCLYNANQKNFHTPITAIVNEFFKQKKHHYFA